MKKTKETTAAVFAATLALACSTLTSCPLAPSLQDLAPFDSQILEYHERFADGTVDENPARSIVYDSTGKPAGRFEMAYDALGYPTRTDVYTYDSDGITNSLTGYYLYAYDVLSRIESGKTYDPAGTLLEEYDVTYHTTLTDRYTDIADWGLNTSTSLWVRTADHVVTYLTDGSSGDGEYRTEQYFTYDSTGTTKSLLKEYAAWYAIPDADGYPRTNCELYHVLKGSDTDILPSGLDEAYYYVSYSYDPKGNTFLQADSWYGDPTNLPSRLPNDIPKGLMGEFTVTPGNPDPFAYPINFNFIGNQASMIIWEFDAYQNPVKASLYLYGILQEIKTYRWLDLDHIAEKARYVNGGATLEQREATRYYDAIVDGEAYQIQETTTYYFGEAPTKNAVARRASSKSFLRAEPGFLPAGMAGTDLIAAYGERIFRKVEDIHE